MPPDAGAPGRACPFCDATVAAERCSACGRDPAARRVACGACGRWTPAAERSCARCGAGQSSGLGGKVLLIVLIFLGCLAVSIVVRVLAR